MAKSKEFVWSSMPVRSSSESSNVRTMPDRVGAYRSAAPNDDELLMGEVSESSILRLLVVEQLAP
eukprot:11547753-Heterocapsa_arctica.AAC.1